MNTEQYYNIQFEKSILSSLLFTPERFKIYNKKLLIATFYMPIHQAIYRAMQELDQLEKPIDEEFLKKQLLKNHAFDESTESMMIEIMTCNPISNLQSYVRELQDLHIEREIKKLTLELLNKKLNLTDFKISLSKVENLYKLEEQKSKMYDDIDYKKLTPFLGNLLQDLMKINNYPATMVLSTVLSSLAGLIGARAKITNGINLTVFPVIWSMIIAPSSVSAKSTLFRYTKKCVFDNMQKNLFDKYEEDLKNYKEDIKKFNALSKEEKMRETEPERPMPKLLIFANDGTPEAKITALSRNQNGGIVYYDEMKAELERSNNDPRYKALKTSIFDGETYHKELVKEGGTFILRNPVLCEIGLITEQWLVESVQKNDLASGFLARYLFSYNKREDFKPLQINDFIINTEIYSNVGKFVLNMLQIDRKESLLFTLTTQAQKFYRDWFNDFSKTAFAVENDEEITASYRLSTYVLKFALILYIFNTANQKIDVVQSNLLEISIEYIKSAIYIMEIFQDQNNKVLNLFQDNKKLNFKIDDIVLKLQKKIRASDEKRLSKSSAQNGIRGLTAKKIDELIEQNIFKTLKIERTIYIVE